MIQNLGNQHSLINQYIAELRDVNIQKDSWRFRKNMSRIGQIFAYEISKQLSYETKEIQTPLGISSIATLKTQPVIASILRASLPFHSGILEFFDQAENAFAAAYRKHDANGNFDIELGYITCPNIHDKVLILTDPMLATGASMLKVYQALLSHGTPCHTHIVSILSAPEGIEYLQKHIPSEQITIWTGAIDQELNPQAYIVPGLGDAGDLAFGIKLQA